ncbi:MAG: phosphoesterase [Rhodospirillaceae bacterium]|nr:phosphoesterase [Rhodospirillaceae bacterium]|tara:strand:- start:209 stop:967 length:759 start_codon:yes stop_codon:yes gene_type:complete
MTVDDLRERFHPRRYLPESWLRLVRSELGPIIGLMLLGAAVLAFGNIAEETLEGDTHAFDRTVLLALRSATDLADPIGPSWVEEMARDITSLGSMAVLTMVSLVVIGYLALHGRRRAGFLILVSVGGGMLLSTGLKLLFGRSRPDLVPHGMEVYTASFPSGHAMLSAVTYLTLGALLARVQPSRRAKVYPLTVAVFLTLMVGMSRIYLGVHWPTDVLAGWSVGAAWALFCWLVALFIQRRAPGSLDSGNIDR